MKIHISPPQVAMRVPLHATSSQGAADMEPRRQDYDRLDLTRQRKFRTIGRGKSESEVDEAAIALVELSVLVYDDIGTIGKTAAKLRDPRLGLFGKRARNRCQTCLSLLTSGGGETMPRPPRVHAEGLLYHVMARGNDGQKIFLSQSDYQALIEALRTVRRPRVIHVTGFCRACGI